MSVALSLLASSCGGADARPTSRQSTSADPESEKDFKAARDVFEAGLFERADEAFDEFTQRHAGDPLRGAALVYRARIAIANGDPGAALTFCAAVGKTQTDDFTRERARLYEGIASSQAGEHERAVRLLAPFAGTLTDPAEARLLLSSLWHSAAAIGDLPRALTWMDAYLSGEPTGAERTAALSDLDALLSRCTNLDSLAEAAAALDPRGAVWPRALGKIVRARYEAADLEAAARALSEIEDAGRVEDAGVSDIATFIEKRTRVDLSAIGCVLPLSGRARAVGEAVLRGVMLGAKTGRTKDGKPFSVVVRDSEGDPARAAAAVDALAVESGVAAIVGPLDGAEAEAVANRAQALGVPVVLLSPTDGLRTSGAPRLFPSSRAEVDAVVGAALETGATRHAILHPDTPYGAALRDQYEAALARFDLSPVAVVAYPEGTQDFSPFAKQLATSGAEVVFVPDTASRIALAAPALAAAGVLATSSGGGAPVSGAILAATSAGFSPELVRRAGRYLQRCLFAAHFSEGASASAGDFARRYRNEYNGEPSHYAMYGYDAIALAMWAISQGHKTRKAIDVAIRSSSSEAAAKAPLAGRFSGFAKDGSPLAPPYVLTLSGDEWKVVR